MAIIDLVNWSPQGSETIYAWKFPHTNLSTYTQLIVNQSQEAILFSKGQIMGKFGPGKHTLNTENLPILRSLFGIPFGGKNPFMAEVWFVNKLTPFNISWSTTSMSIHDVDYNTQIPLVAKGRYGLKIKDSEKFLIKIVGTKDEFTQQDLTDQFYGEYSAKTKSCIVQYMLSNHIGYKSISAYLDQLSAFLKTNLSSTWEAIGLELTQFYITSIDIDTSTENGRRIADAISQQSSMSITGHTWQQEKMFDMTNNAIDGFTTMAGSSGTGGLIGGLMAINMMGNMTHGGGNLAGGMMNPQYNQPTFNNNAQNNQQQNMQNQQPQYRMVFCSNCSKKYPSNNKFCPYCGDPYNPCPKCGTDNDLNAKRCISCGTVLVSDNQVCPFCQSPIQPGAMFCNNCGHALVQNDNNCSRCGAPLPATAKFCPKCGQKR